MKKFKKFLDIQTSYRISKIMHNMPDLEMVLFYSYPLFVIGVLIYAMIE